MCKFRNHKYFQVSFQMPFTCNCVMFFILSFLIDSSSNDYLIISGMTGHILDKTPPALPILSEFICLTDIVLLHPNQYYHQKCMLARKQLLSKVGINCSMNEWICLPVCFLATCSVLLCQSCFLLTLPLFLIQVCVNYGHWKLCAFDKIHFFIIRADNQFKNKNELFFIIITSVIISA